MSAVPKSSLEEPASISPSHGNVEESTATLDRLWQMATIEIMHAQREYIELEGRSSVDDRVLAEAWLRLWRAEQRQRELALLMR